MSIDQATSLLASVTLFEMMVAIGLGVTFSDVTGVARNGRLIGRAALANYVCVPTAAVLVLLLFQPYAQDQANYALIAVGFLIAAVCPGAPYGPPFTGLAKGNVAVAVGLMVILAGSSALVAPLLLQLLLPLLLTFLPPLPPGSPPLQIDVVRMVGTLGIAQFLPLCIGLAVRQWRPALAGRLKRPANLLSVALNLATLAVILTAQWRMITAIPPVAYAGVLALVLAALAAGWLWSGPAKERRTAMVMATAVRNVGVALVIATTSFPGTRAVAAATIFALFQTILLALVALAWGRLTPSPGEAPTEVKSPLSQSRTVVKLAGP